jgi:hypothetical protein
MPTLPRVSPPTRRKERPRAVLNTPVVGPSKRSRARLSFAGAEASAGQLTSGGRSRAIHRLQLGMRSAAPLRTTSAPREREAGWRTTSSPRTSQAPRRVSGAGRRGARRGPQHHPVVGHQPEALGERPQRQVALAGAGGPSISTPRQKPPGGARSGRRGRSARGSSRPRAGSAGRGRRHLAVFRHAVLGLQGSRRAPRRLAGDGEAEAGVAAERRTFRDARLEPLEHRLEVLRRDAGPQSVRCDDRPWRAAGRRTDLAAWRVEGGALSMRLRNTWRAAPRTRIPSPCPARPADRKGTVTSPGLGGAVERGRCRRSAVRSMASAGPRESSASSREALECR